MNIIIQDFITTSLGVCSTLAPYFVKYLIGYCHFYYQLGYGLIFYIYLYRRHKAKKTKNWSTFYGNSITNWMLFNISVFNKYIFNRSYIIFIKSLLSQFITLLKFWAFHIALYKPSAIKLKHLYAVFHKRYILYNWTPLFKRTSYISFFSFLKRFSKRK